MLIRKSILATEKKDRYDSIHTIVGTRASDHDCLLPQHCVTAAAVLKSSNRGEATKQSKVWAKAFTHCNREIYHRRSMYCVASNCNLLFDTVRDYDASKRVCVNVQEASAQPPWIARPRSGDGPGVGSCIGKCHCKKKNIVQMPSKPQLALPLSPGSLLACGVKSGKEHGTTSWS